VQFPRVALLQGHDGKEGVSKVIHALKEELSMAMALSGFSSINQINKEILFQ
jgi:isopentenyl diphosphate isomerase/L-lactate dehydrogenase-like FMN-dependent dehydrogenase